MPWRSRRARQYGDPSGATALTGATVQAIDANDYQINFGDASGGRWQPLLVANYDDGSGNNTFTSGFLPAVEVSMVRQPEMLYRIPVSHRSGRSRRRISSMRSRRTSANVNIAPIVFSQTLPEAYTGMPDRR